MYVRFSVQSQSVDQMTKSKTDFNSALSPVTFGRTFPRIRTFLYTLFSAHAARVWGLVFMRGVVSSMGPLHDRALFMKTRVLWKSAPAGLQTLCMIELDNSSLHKVRLFASPENLIMAAEPTYSNTTTTPRERALVRKERWAPQRAMLSVKACSFLATRF